jgi:hypothetical protein
MSGEEMPAYLDKRYTIGDGFNRFADRGTLFD